MMTSKSVRSTQAKYNRLPGRSRIHCFLGFHMIPRNISPSSYFEISCQCADIVRLSWFVLYGTFASNEVPRVAIASLSVDRSYLVDHVSRFLFEESASLGRVTGCVD